MIENRIFERVDYTQVSLPKGEYECCRFLNCNFYSADISNITFRDCEFDGCDFSLATIKNTSLNDARFIGCKLLGVQFDECNTFLLSFQFENCLLKLTVFNKLKLKKMHFKNCNLQEADFTEVDLTSSNFENCDLKRAIFHKTVLEKVNFSTAYNYSIDPEQNRIKKARFSSIGLAGLLDKYGIVID